MKRMALCAALAVGLVSAASGQSLSEFDNGVLMGAAYVAQHPGVKPVDALLALKKDLAAIAVANEELAKTVLPLSIEVQKLREEMAKLEFSLERARRNLVYIKARTNSMFFATLPPSPPGLVLLDQAEPTAAKPEAAKPEIAKNNKPPFSDGTCRSKPTTEVAKSEPPKK